MSAPLDSAALQSLADRLRASRGMLHKTDIAAVAGELERRPGLPADDANGLGDDCAALRDPAGDGWLLFAMEGLVEELVEAMPWFAGFCGVLVNVSDVAAMGGRPLAVADALWARSAAQGAEIIAGMSAAAEALGVPIAGGHSNYRAARDQLAVAIVGRARRLLTSFDAHPGDVLVMACDLRGAWVEPYPYWNAATEAPGARLRGDLALLPDIAEAGLSRAAKDISMAGIVGTALMLAECSRVGLALDLDAIPRPPGVDLERWLTAFPSYGFLLAVAPADVAAVVARFTARDLAAAPVGRITDGSQLVLEAATTGATAPFWDWRARPFIRPAQAA